ncbi:transglycosylase SLT domain-containing protein [Maritimibacter sp. DP07]|jgi:soluble lytic murein transglycosylase-like protein|uniref:Transglycosylase SLT domain-containing protein n=1 Tax=Maritimibacter harenae TaxID=2606218 RepID=A0A845M202_9RHOB|nr:lytic transglycosylase domain-containing protein [Maritimibacter harenae]MZR11747.1 transglycosylase SLT domain-containing protein [Maritimibacter harenae]
MRTRSIFLLGLAGLLALPSAAAAQSGGDFTFKRMAVPKPGATRRITVQIDPEAQARARAELAAEAAARETPAEEAEGAPAGAYDWFWTEVSPVAAEGGPANLARALDLIAREGREGPRLQTLQNIARAYGPDILMATVGTEISPALVLALISVESAGRAQAESDKGARGLMQLIPDTAARFGVEDATDPAQNIRGGVAYLDWLMEHFERDAILSLAGYNAGENAVAKHDGVPPYAETRAYVPKVLAAWRVARGLCLTPPELMSDGCVFAVNGNTSNG